MKITCQVMRKVFWAYVDGEVKKEVQESIEVHLCECVGPCASYYNTVQATLNLCRQLPEVPVPQELIDALDEIWED